MSLLSSVVVLLHAASGTAVSLDDRAGCVPPAALDGAVADAIPDDWDEAQRGALRVHVAVSESTVELVAHAAGDAEPLVTRAVTYVAPTDCAELPRLLGVILARALDELPRERWPRRASPVPAARPQPDAPGWESHLTLSGALDAGLDSSAWGGRLTFGAGFGPPAGPHLLVAVAASALAPIPVGLGEAQLTQVMAGVGAGWDLPLSDWTLTPIVLVSGGVAISSGLGFDAPTTAIVPALRAAAGLTLTFPLGLFIGAHVDVALLRVRLAQRDTAATRLEPAVRGIFEIGLRLTL